MSARSRRRRTPVCLVVLVAAAALSGCGGSGAGGVRAGRGAPGPTASSSASAPGGATTIPVDAAVFASPTGAFLCSLDDGVAVCMWPRHLHGITAPAAVCSPVADEGPELRPGRAPGWLCGTDVAVVAATDTIAWAPPGTSAAPAVDGLASPELTDGLTLTSGPTRCRGAGRGVRCTSSGGWFLLEPGHFASGRR